MCGMGVAEPTTRRTRRPAAETREHVLEVAHELFYWEGIRATGVDRVAARAGVGPTTLYRLFASKDDLVTAYIERSAAGYRDLILKVTDPTAGAPRERILGLFDAVAEQVQPAQCRGCPFLMALAEYPDPTSTVHAAAVAVKDWVRTRLRELVDELDVSDAGAVGDQLALVLEGVYASVAALTAAGPATQARAAAEVILDAHA
jgi:AcrR family transcriptional regulator